MNKKDLDIIISGNISKYKAIDTLQVTIGSPSKDETGKIIFDPSKCKSVSQDSISKFFIIENIFTHLPILELHIYDSGEFFNTYRLGIGVAVYVSLTPTLTDFGEDIKSYINSEFSIQSINTYLDTDSEKYVHKLICVYNSESYLNEVCKYPLGSLLNNSFYAKKNSDEVLKDILSNGPLSVVSDINPKDASYWFSASETYSQFITRIVNHSWINENDCPILFTDVNGLLHYTSIKTLCSNSNIRKYGSISKTSKNVNNIQATSRDDFNIPMMFTDAVLISAGGPILNKGGYIVEGNVYNPYNESNMDVKDLFPHAYLGFANIKQSNLSHRTISFDSNNSLLGGFKNKPKSLLNNISKHKNCGVHFDELHQYYDVAPEHHEMFRRNFFQNFYKLTIDLERQHTIYKLAENRPKLGDKIYIDFSTENTEDKIHSGSYIIVGIRHNYKVGSTYTLALTVVSDSYYNIGAGDVKKSEGEK